MLSQAQIAASVDAASYKDGMKQANGAWSALGTDGSSAWGAIQGSARDPYFVCIALDEAALPSKCTCPSRKFPCKHAIGLALAYLADSSRFPTSAPPESVLTWVANRQKRAKPAESAPPVDLPPDDPAAAKKAAKKQKTVDARAAKVAAGMADLRLRLCDIVRAGLSDSRLYTYAFWDDMARRMVDAQVRGVATRLQSIGGMAVQGARIQLDPSPLLDEIARLYLLAEGFARIETLPPATQADIRALVGFSMREDEVIESGEGVNDTWLVMGQTFEPLTHLLMRTVWLYGALTDRWAAIIDFQPQGMYGSSKPRFADHYVVGEIFNAILVYYPSAYPQRALVKERHAVSSFALSNHEAALAFALPTMTAALDGYATALGSNPFLERFPMALKGIRLGSDGERAMLYDADGRQIAPTNGKLREKVLLAAGGGGAFPIFGEWDGYTFRALSVYADGMIFALE